MKTFVLIFSSKFSEDSILSRLVHIILMEGYGEIKSVGFIYILFISKMIRNGPFISKILPSRINLSPRHKNRKWPMKSLDSREVTDEITGFLYLWRSDKFSRLDFRYRVAPSRPCCWMFIIATERFIKVILKT